MATALNRRLSAPRRVGAPYRVTHLSAAPGIDLQEWLPPEFLQRTD